MCHICGKPADSILKCKLCCDGLEQDACARCVSIYNAYKQSIHFGIGLLTGEYFGQLKALRAECIANERKTNGHATEKRYSENGKR